MVKSRNYFNELYFRHIYFAKSLDKVGKYVNIHYSVSF